MSYHIIIRDDEWTFVKKLCTDIDQIISKITSDYSIKIYNNSELLERDIVLGRVRCDILFSAILMKGKNGIELTADLRNHGLAGSIVFVTNYPEYSLQGYSVYPLNFLVKPVDKGKLAEVLLKDYNFKTDTHQMVLKGVGGDTIVEQADLYYFVMRGRKIHAVLRGGETVLTGTMNRLEQELAGKPFVRCHKGFIVNMDKITKVNRSEIVLPQSMKIPVGRTYYKMTLERIEQHIHN